MWTVNVTVHHCLAMADELEGDSIQEFVATGQKSFAYEKITKVVLCINGKKMLDGA